MGRSSRTRDTRLPAWFALAALGFVALAGCSDPEPPDRPGTLTVAPAAEGALTEEAPEDGMPPILREALEEMLATGLAAQRPVTAAERHAIEDYFEAQNPVGERKDTYRYKGQVFHWSVTDP